MGIGSWVCLGTWKLVVGRWREAGEPEPAAGNFDFLEDGMLGRALSLAAVSMLVGCLAALPARAQNLEAGKSPSQIFSGACALCHKSPRGLLKTVAPGSLPGFLRQHYTDRKSVV